MQKLSETGNLSIVVLGTSMTEGRASNFTWARRLEELFGEAGLDVSVRNLAQGGSTSEVIIAGWQKLEPKLKGADIIIVDYMINDNWASRAGYGEAARLLTQLPRRPGVIDLLTFSNTHRGKMITDNCSQVDLGAFQHVPDDKDMNIPMISYTEAVCPTGRTLWMGQGEDYDCTACSHPGSQTHDLVAQIVYSVLRGEMEKACKGLLGRDITPAKGGEGGCSACLARPTTSLDAISGTLQPLSADPEWRLYEDVPKKPGWIADEHSYNRSIAFNVTTNVGWIQVEYLGTYENIGSSSVYIDGADPLDQRTCKLDGRWHDEVSLSKFTRMKTRLPAGPHTLTFVGQGEKFKLLGIVAC